MARPEHQGDSYLAAIDVVSSFLLQINRMLRAKK